MMVSTYQRRAMDGVLDVAGAAAVVIPDMVRPQALLSLLG